MVKKLNIGEISDYIELQELKAEYFSTCTAYLANMLDRSISDEDRIKVNNSIVDVSEFFDDVKVSIIELKEQINASFGLIISVTNKYNR